jgi:phosphoesterase RecJ-like protein
MLDFKNFHSSFAKVKSVGITAPAGADGDSVGTQLALFEILKKQFKSLDVRIINEEPCPKRYRFLKYTEFFEVASDILKQSPQSFPECMVCVDGGFSRIGPKTTEIWKNAKLLGQVDHHALGGENPYHFRLYDPAAASTTEIVFRYLEQSGIPLTQSLAEAIYVGLIFDTGMFKHSNTRPDTLHIAAKLLETGFSQTTVAEKSMLIRSKGAFELLKYVLGQAQFDVADRYVWSALDFAQFQKLSGDPDEREGLIDHLFLTEKCEIAALFFEKNPDEWKVSFRSRNWDVATLAKSLNAQGGGHKLAAGCSLNGSQKDILKVSHDAVRKLLG